MYLIEIYSFIRTPSTSNMSIIEPELAVEGDAISGSMMGMFDVEGVRIKE